MNSFFLSAVICIKVSCSRESTMNQPSVHRLSLGRLLPWRKNTISKADSNDWRSHFRYDGSATLCVLTRLFPNL